MEAKIQHGPQVDVDLKWTAEAVRLLRSQWHEMTGQRNTKDLDRVLDALDDVQINGWVENLLNTGVLKC
jgi:hypothetical protein